MYSGLELAGRYRLDHLLGRGRMGEVWHAIDDRLDRAVAVKLVPYHVGLDQALMTRLRREAQITAGVQHAGITVVYDTGEHQQMLYVVMERLKGETLASVLEKHPRGLHVADILYFAEQIAETLAAAHAQGIVHRDIRPANLMVLDERGRIKICDFGIARFAEVTAGLRGGGFVGDPAYMAPEQFEGGRVSNRTDLYAFGCVLYEMQTGVPPFRTDRGVNTLMHAHLRVPPPSPRAAFPQLPPELDELTLALLTKKPADRPEDADDVADRFREIRARLASGAPPPPAAPPTTPARGRGPQAPEQPEDGPDSPGRAADRPGADQSAGAFPGPAPRDHQVRTPARSTPPDNHVATGQPTGAFPGPAPRDHRVRTPARPTPPDNHVATGQPTSAFPGPAPRNPRVHAPGSPGPDGPSDRAAGRRPAGPPEPPPAGPPEPSPGLLDAPPARPPGPAAGPSGAPDDAAPGAAPGAAQGSELDGPVSDEHPAAPSGRGEDIETDVDIDFAESISGVVIPLQISDDSTCRECSGYGLAGSDVCPDCEGRGQVTQVRNVRVRIPPGTRDQQRILLPGKGADGLKGQSPGDLYLQIHVEPHRVFGRLDDHLTITVPMSYEEATQGGEMKVPVLGGPPVLVRIPPATPNGRVFRLRRHGVGRQDGSRGDLLVTVEVHVPQGPGRSAADLREELIQAANEI